MPAPLETPRNRPLTGKTLLAACRGLRWQDTASGALIAACTAAVLLGDGWTPLAGYAACMAGLAGYAACMAGLAALGALDRR